MWSLPALVLGACVPMEPSGNLLAPADGGAGPVFTRPAAPGLARALSGKAQGDFDFEAEDREPGTPGAATSVDPLQLQAKLLGVPVDQVQRLATAVQVPTDLPPVAAPIWDPSVTIPEASFGIRVLAVVLDLQPPRAVISLPDGREQVVTPGAMLPSDGLVVLAIGRDAVQVAKVTPSGFYARVETDTIRALYPQQSPSGP